MPPTLAQEIGKKKPFDFLEQEATLNIVRTASVLQEPFERLFREHGVSSALYNILRIARGVGGSGVATGEIAPQMVTPAPDVTRLVDRLERLALAERRRDEADRRVVRVRITPKGRRLLARLAPVIERLHRETLAGFTRDELRLVNELMVKARDSASRAVAPRTLGRRDDEVSVAAPSLSKNP